MLVQYLINVKPLFVAYSPRPDEVMIVRYVQPLTDEQRALLEKTMKEDTAFRARSRAHSLLLSAGGHAYPDHCQDLSGPSCHRVSLDQKMGTAWRPEFA